MKHQSRERGQATVELCIGLLGIVFVVIAIIYFGGIGITSIKTLLNARYNAEQRGSAGRSQIQTSAASKTIRAWRYTGAKYKKSEELTIPFLAHDTPYSGSGISNDFFHTPEYSYGSMPDDENGHLQYQFIPISSEETGLPRYNRLLDSGDPANLADLRHSDGILPREIQRSGEEVYTMHTMHNSNKMKKNLKKGFFDFTKVKINEWRSNTAAYPVFQGKE